MGWEAALTRQQPANAFSSDFLAFQNRKMFFF